MKKRTRTVRLNTGYGARIKVKVPDKVKGKKITPSVYKVRDSKTGNKLKAIVGLYYNENGKVKVYKNKVVYF